MTQIVGCGTEEMGFTECVICNAYKDDPVGCLEWRRANGAKTKEVNEQ